MEKEKNVTLVLLHEIQNLLWWKMEPFNFKLSIR